MKTFFDEELKKMINFADTKLDALFKQELNVYKSINYVSKKIHRSEYKVFLIQDENLRNYAINQIKSKKHDKNIKIEQGKYGIRISLIINEDTT